MNYFRCTVGGSGKGNTVTVTCAEEFAGLTITLAKTGKTYTKTCPSTAPYVVTFYGVENGTYTVSATYGGRTYSESVVVKNIDCALNYGFGWVTWVNTAQYLDASDYASLDEVLEDEAAIRELFLEHTCVDYMAEAPASNIALQTIINNDLCAKWINLSDYALDYLYANEVIADLMDEADKYGYGEWALMPQVPTMTSNTAPYGEASAESINGTSYPAWKAFDNDMSSSSMWASAVNHPTNTWVQYKFTNQVRVTKILIVNRWDTYNTQNVKDFKVQGSNDGTNFTDIYTGECLQSTSFEEQTFEFSNDDAYSYYRLLITSNYGSTECSSVCGLQFYAWVPKGNVPIMTSNTAPYGEAIITSQQTNYEAYRVFDMNYATKCAINGTAISAYVGYKFTNPISVRKTYIYVDITDRDLTFQVQYSDDNSTWTNASEVIEMERGKVAHIDVADSGYHLYWRIVRTVIDGGAAISGICNELQFYGRELKVSVPTMTSNTAPYGEAFSNSVYSANYLAYKAFDGNTSTLWGSRDGATNSYIQYKFTDKIVPKFVYILNRTEANYATGSCIIQASNDGTTFIDLKTLSNMVASGAYYETIDDNDEYKYIRIQITNTLGTKAGQGFRELQFYGLDYSEKEFEAGTTKKWLYDHGVELEELNAYYDSSVPHGTVTKNESSMILDAVNNNGFVGAGTEIDLTAYTRAYTKMNILSEYSSGNGTKGIRVGSLSSGSVISSDAEVGIKIWNPYQLAVLDISNFNQVKAICSRTYVGKCTLFELWLE